MKLIILRSLMVFAVAALFAPSADADGILDPKLEYILATQTGPYQVIVTFKSQADVQQLAELGVTFLPLKVLPMAGVILTKEQIETVLEWESVESVYYNDRLRYFNHDSGNIAGAHYVQQVLGFKGRGSTIVVLDSGIDATHPDLPFRSKVLENVKILGDLGIIGTTTYVEGVVNTDNTSGHGTHVAGTVGGTGAASANDLRDPFYYRGVAPEASLVGLGAGEALFILHALAGFDYAIANKDRFGVTVITNSWGNTSSSYNPSDPISIASYEAYRKGIVVTFAAGNEGPNDNTMSSYAINPWVIGVAAGTKSKELADFSSRGEASEPFEHPDITAPGVDITSTRAVGTPVGALGTVVDLNNPTYTLYYHTISGTSMATPFVAGSVALLKEANPQLSPDQIEEILVATADAMPYPQHQVGAGYINVQSAVELAQQTTGTLPQFLAGDTKWSSQGTFAVTEESHSHIGYEGNWKTIANSNVSGGTYKVGTPAKKGKKPVVTPAVRITFYGTNVKLGYPTNRDGGVAEVLIDGVSRGTVSFYSNEERWNARSAFGGLSNTSHSLELRGLNGKMYLDKLSVDGELYPNGTQFVDESFAYTGFMGPSVEGAPETSEIPFAVSDNTVRIIGELAWSGALDLDLYLLDPDGNPVASSASLDNPEALSYWVTRPGTYTYRIVGYATVAAEYVLTSTMTKAVVSEGALAKAAERSSRALASTGPVEFELAQNYPNPFNPVTRIRYTLPGSGYVSLKVFNVLGKEVAELVEGYMETGTYSVRFGGEEFPSGIYLYRLEFVDAKGLLLTKVNRMVLLK